MGTAEIVQRLVTFATATAAIAAVVAYIRGHRIAALALNGVCPLLIIGVGALSLALAGPLRFTLVGVLFFVFQALALVASALGTARRSPNAALFWTVWAVNILTFAFFAYLTFFFHIF
jgi:hypothetical protein